jgi:hypothetical protein
MAALVQSADAGIFVELRNPALFEQARVDMGTANGPGSS